ncbi:MAG: hypothetical protein IT437_03315 [Phycisphaerales bacterium]|nr:hypothetical protein [Phycisphaerales bacterium]
MESAPDEPRPASDPLTSERGRRARAAVTAVILLAVITAWTTVCIRGSLRSGRLLLPPGFDDIAYQLDAARRIDQLHREGFGGFVHGLWQRPPKSVYSTGADMAAIALIGDQPWAPYATNALVIGVLLWSVWRTGAALGLFSRVMLTLLTLALPMANRAVTEFRPDILSGLLVAAGCVLVLEPRFAGWRRAFLVGIVFGAGAFVKPTAAPAVGVIACAALGLGCAVSQRRGPVAERVFGWLEGMIAGGIGAAILPGLYAIIGTGFTVDYLRYNLWGAGRGLWVREMSTASSFLYYITGPGGDFMLGPAAVPLLVLALAGGVCGCIRLNGAERARAAAGVALLVLTYVIATATPIKQVFFGVQFQALVILLAAGTVARGAVRLDHLRPRIPIGGAALAACFLAACALGIPRLQNPPPAPRVAEINAIYDDVAEAVRDYARPRPHTYVFLTFVGGVNSANLGYRALRAGLPVEVASADGQSRPEGFGPWLKKADLVLALPAGTTFDIGRMPTGRMLDESLEMMLGRPDFRVLRRFPLRRVLPRPYKGALPPEVVLFERVPEAPNP